MLNDTQIQNWRTTLRTLLGSLAATFSDAEIQAFRDQMQQRANEIQVCTECEELMKNDVCSNEVCSEYTHKDCEYSPCEDCHSIAIDRAMDYADMER